jgi:hypothetical protein
MYRRVVEVAEVLMIVIPLSLLPCVPRTVAVLLVVPHRKPVSDAKRLHHLPPGHHSKTIRSKK